MNVARLIVSRRRVRAVAVVATGMAVFGISFAGTGEEDWSRNVNTLGLGILRAQEPGNAAVSPVSLTTTLLMTWTGTAGGTRSEMSKALGFGEDTGRVDAQFWKGIRGGREGVVIAQANRLFLQSGLPLLERFQAELRETFDAPIESVDFSTQAERARRTINRWVVKQTRGKIENLIPDGGVNALTRLVLVNAVYFFGPWEHAFKKAQTEPREFFLNAKEKVKVSTMRQRESFGYRTGNGFTAITLPYADPELQMLILLPDDAGRLPELEAKLDAQTLRELASLPSREVDLFLPRFRIETEAMELTPALKAMGVKRLFDDPPRSADLSRMVEGGGDLYVSKVFQKVFVDVSEKGTEAAAATGVVAALRGAMPAEPVTVHVNRPFLFAIQHREIGACLFLGRVVDPR